MIKSFAMLQNIQAIFSDWDHNLGFAFRFITIKSNLIRNLVSRHSIEATQDWRFEFIFKPYSGCSIKEKQRGVSEAYKVGFVAQKLTEGHIQSSVIWCPDIEQLSEKIHIFKLIDISALKVLKPSLLDVNVAVGSTNKLILHQHWHHPFRNIRQRNLDCISFLIWFSFIHWLFSSRLTWPRFLGFILEFAEPLFDKLCLESILRLCPHLEVVLLPEAKLLWYGWVILLLFRCWLAFDFLFLKFIEVIVQILHFQINIISKIGR